MEKARVMAPGKIPTAVELYRQQKSDIIKQLSPATNKENQDQSAINVKRGNQIVIKPIPLG